MADATPPAGPLHAAVRALTAATAVVGAVLVARGVANVLTMRRWRRELIVVEGKRKGLPAPGPPPSLLVGNTPALAHAYYRTLYAHVEHPVSVFYVHATPFVVVNDAAAVRTVLSGAAGAFVKPRYFGYRSATVRAAVDADAALCAATAADGSPVGGGGVASRRVLLRLLDAHLPLVCGAVEALLASFPARRRAERARRGRRADRVGVRAVWAGPPRVRGRRGGADGAQGGGAGRRR